jgi:hypothetical protein
MVKAKQITDKFQAANILITGLSVNGTSAVVTTNISGACANAGQNGTSNVSVPFQVSTNDTKS